MRRRRSPAYRGSLTVFLCLLLTLIFGVIGACLEYSRAQAVSCQAQLAANAAAESIFAGYHAPLHARYQLLGRLIPGADFGELEEETLHYVAGCSGQRTSLLGHGGLVSYQEEEASWSEVSFLTDQNGAIFTYQAAKAILYSGVDILTDEWAERLGLTGGETESAYRENSEKENVSAAEFLSGYADWSEELQQAQEEAEAKAREADAQEAAEAAVTSEEGEATETAAAENANQKALEEERAKGKHFLDMVNDLKELAGRGVLGLVLPEGKNVSAGQITSGNLPSELSSSMKSRCVGESVSGGNGLLFREYLMRNLDCFTSDTDKPIAYELEYVIAGKKTDQANLEAVLSKILLMRTALNLTYLSRSPAKQAEVAEAAALAVGWTGNPAIVEVTSKVFLAAWALAEGAYDVRHLLAGKKVELMKTDAGWHLQFANLLEEMTESAVDMDDNAEEQGLSYEDYLRILLYLTGTETAAYRGMDVVQWNIARIDSAFVLSDCMVSGSLTIQVSTQAIFSPLYGSLGRVGQANLEKQSAFSYISS